MAPNVVIPLVIQPRRRDRVQPLAPRLTSSAIMPVAKLDAIAEESHQTDDVDELLEYAIRAIAIMKCSIEAAKFSLQATLVDLALDGLLCSDDEDLRRVSNIRTVGANTAISSSASAGNWSAKRPLE